MKSKFIWTAFRKVNKISEAATSLNCFAFYGVGIECHWIWSIVEITFTNYSSTLNRLNRENIHTIPRTMNRPRMGANVIYWIILISTDFARPIPIHSDAFPSKSYTFSVYWMFSFYVLKVNRTAFQSFEMAIWVVLKWHLLCGCHQVNC